MEIISKESIKPSTKTPVQLRIFRLSLLDQSMPSLYFSLILYYSYDKNGSNVKQAEISPILKKSLSNALALYYPFAGRTKGESSIVCDDQGVDYLEARVDTRLTEIIESPNVEVLNQFVPSTSEESGGVLLRIQLNYFTCGGIAIGISISHIIADACTLSMFVKTWAAIARGDINLVAPSFVTSSLFPPRESSGQGKHTPHESPKHRTITRRFCFSSSKIASLRAEVGATCSVVQPTRVELVTAAIWKRIMGPKECDQRRLSVANHTMDLRRRMDPPLSEYAFGNLLWGASALGNGEMDLGGLVIKIREAFGEIEFLKECRGENGYDMIMRNSKKVLEWIFNKEVDLFMFTSWCRFPIYEADFSWGKPAWVSTAHLGGRPKNILLMDSISDIGGIEAWISLDEVDMLKFEQESPNS